MIKWAWGDVCSKLQRILNEQIRIVLPWSQTYLFSRQNATLQWSAESLCILCSTVYMAKVIVSAEYYAWLCEICSDLSCGTQDQTNAYACRD